MKLRRITPNPSSEYKWENGEAKYAVVYKNCVPNPVIAVFDSKYWAEKFVGEASIILEMKFVGEASDILEIMEIDYDS